ncbi:xylose isomerase [Actinorhabdospora filicis]|uniref:Xylose isomerase n=1 Tax=Actinorhabdospora filicis TaxID=1785913 RepID=A0A9W6WBK5_9ACTN|nr:sugar phosphate isomerase/epimerase [Actinorhabdospora filicis]GLZ80168.1 xylose isomerase [Actinorhabdospora filicis]
MTHPTPPPPTHSIQLYTLRHQLEQSPAATLSALATLGYTTVELAGLKGLTPTAFRRLLDDSGLRASSAHVPLRDTEAGVDEMLEDAATLGNTHLVIPMARFDDADGWKRFAESLTAAAAKAKDQGIALGYHNHAHEFAPLPDGQRPYDVLTAYTDAALVHLELDFYWAVHAGVDPRDILGAHRGRVKQVHVKDRTLTGAMADPGEGAIAFTDLIPMAERSGVVEFIVERDDSPDPLKTAKTGLDFLRTF